MCFFLLRDQIELNSSLEPESVKVAAQSVNGLKQPVYRLNGTAIMYQK